MIKCHLSRLLGERKLKISDVTRDTGINRGTLTRLYHETAERVELDVLDALCTYLNCGLPTCWSIKRVSRPLQPNSPTATDREQEGVTHASGAVPSGHGARRSNSPRFAKRGILSGHRMGTVWALGGHKLQPEPEKQKGPST